MLQFQIKRNFFICLSIVFILSSLSACGDNDGNTPITPTSTQISGISKFIYLPNPMDPIKASTATSSNVSSDTNSGVLNLNQYDDNTFNAQSSLLACETASQSITAFEILSTGSIGYCMLQQLNDQLTTAVPDLYDGKDHVLDVVLTMNGQESKEGSARVKIKVNREENIIKSFKMYICGVDENNQSHQFNYITQTISDNNFWMQYKGTDGGGSGWHNAIITGTLQFLEDANGNTTAQFINTKNMTTQSTTIRSEQRYSEINLQQSINTLSYKGYHVVASDMGTQSSQTNSITQLIDRNVSGSTYDIGLLALGNGQGENTSIQSLTPNGEYDYNVTTSEGWSGDTRMTDPQITNIDLPPPPLPGTPLTETLNSFNGDEADDCTTDSTEIPKLTIEVANLQGSCLSSLNWENAEYVDCYNKTQGF